MHWNSNHSSEFIRLQSAKTHRIFFSVTLPQPCRCHLPDGAGDSYLSFGKNFYIMEVLDNFRTAKITFKYQHITGLVLYSLWPKRHFLLNINPPPPKKNTQRCPVLIFLPLAPNQKRLPLAWDPCHFWRHPSHDRKAIARPHGLAVAHTLEEWTIEDRIWPLKENSRTLAGG